jgi:hypothetical protein
MPTLHSSSEESPKNTTSKIHFSLSVIGRIIEEKLSLAAHWAQEKQNRGIWSSQWISKAVKGDLLNAAISLSCALFRV